MNINFHFTNFGFGEIFKDSSKIDSVNDNHKQSIVAVADSLSLFNSPRGEAVEFKSIPDLVGLEYVGYVIEKERFDLSTQRWIRIDELRFIGSKTNLFRDTRIAYGYTYRYRIKSVVKITVKKEKNSLNNFLQQDLQKYVKENVEHQIDKKLNSIEQLKIDGNNGAEIKKSSGILDKSVAISDQVQVKLQPDNSVILSEIIGGNSRQVSQEQFTLSLSDVERQNAKVSKEYEYVSMYYESVASDWTIVDVVKNLVPSYPQNINIVPNSRKKEIMLSWLKPVSEVEVKFYNVYRRNSVGAPWTVIAEGLKEFETLFIDRNVLFSQKYVYAITSIDVHGIESFLSIQIQAELNPNIEKEKKEKNIVFVSGGGVKPEEINLILKLFLQKKENLVARRNIVLKPNTKFREESRDFLIKITSLDTHEKIELVVTLQNQKETK